MVEKKEITVKRKAYLGNVEVLSKPLIEENNAKKRKVDEDPDNTASNNINNGSESNSLVINQALLKPKTPPVFTQNISAVREYYLPRNDFGNRLLYIKDIQDLILYATMGVVSIDKPRWCSISHRQHLQKVVVAVVECASAEDMLEHQVVMPFLNSNFEYKFKVMSPSQYSGSALDELLMIDEDGTQHPVIYKSKATIHSDVKIDRMTDPSLVVNSNRINSGGKTTKVDLMLTPEEMKMEGYSLPFVNNVKTRDFKYSRKSYRMPTANSPMYAIDCEMVTTTDENELASICVVDENLKCIYKTFVKPDNRILNYNTKFSGITKDVLENVSTKLSDVQEHLSNILPDDVILVGQSLNFDLNVIKIFHPFVIDTSCIYNLSGYKVRKSRLQLLAKLFLKREIQNDVEGHCAQEDAEAAMQLVLLKLNKGYCYGNVVQNWTVDNLEDPDLHSHVDQSVAVTTNDSKKFKKDDRKLIFFRTSLNYKNIFQLAANVGRTSLLFGSVNTIPEVYRTCDSQALKYCRNAIESDECFLTVAHLHEVKDSIQGDECSNPDGGNSKCSKCFKRSLKDADRRLKKVFNTLPTRSLMVVLFTGRTNGTKAQDGLCFVGIKGEELM